MLPLTINHLSCASCILLDLYCKINIYIFRSCCFDSCLTWFLFYFIIFNFFLVITRLKSWLLSNPCCLCSTFWKRTMFWASDTFCVAICWRNESCLPWIDTGHHDPEGSLIDELVKDADRLLSCLATKAIKLHSFIMIWLLISSSIEFLMHLQ